MKINGKKIEGVNVAWAIIPREPESINIKCVAVLSYDEFNKLVPEPQAPTVVRPGGDKTQDFEDPQYQEAITKRRGLEIDWMYLQSMAATEGLSWETVDAANPDTWKNWKTELEASGFNQNEISIIIDAIWKANTLGERMIRAARESFFRSHPEERRR